MGDFQKSNLMQIWLPSLFTGFPAFVFVTVLCSSVCVLLLVSYAFFRRSDGSLRKSLLVREVLVRFQWPLWLLIMTNVFVVANHLLVRGMAVGIWDVNGAYYPYQVLVADHARAGRFLHWDPWSDAGMPASGDPQFGAFSPVTVIIGLITGGTSSGFMVYWLLMWWLGGLGIMMLARHLKAPAWGAAVVAVSFLFCGTYIGHAEHTSLITAYSLMPFVIWRLDVALGCRRFRPAIEAGAIWGLSALAGYPANTILTGCFAGLWAIGRWLCAESVNSESSTDRHDVELTERPRFTLHFVVSALFLMLLVGFAVLAPTYFAYFYDGGWHP